MFICSIAVSLTEQNSVLEKIRRNGFLFSIGIAINRLVPVWLFRFSRVVFYEMDPEKFEVETDKSAEQHEASIQVSWCETEDELRAVEKLTYTSAEKLDADYKIAQATSGKELAGALWAIKDTFTEYDLGISYRLEPGQYWLFAALVNSKFRRRGIYGKVLGFMCREGKTEFATNEAPTPQLLLCVNPHNIASNRVHKKYANDVLGHAVSMKIFNIAFCICFGKKISSSSIFTWDAKNRPILIRLGSL